MAVKISRALVAKAKYLAELEGVTLAEYLNGVLEGPLNKNFAKATGGKD